MKCVGKCQCKDIIRKGNRAAKDAAALGISLKVEEEKITAIQDAMKDLEKAHQEEIDGLQAKYKLEKQERVQKLRERMEGQSITWAAGESPDSDTEIRWEYIRKRRAGTLRYWHLLGHYGLDISEQYVDNSYPEWIRKGVGITKYTMVLDPSEPGLEDDLRPEGATGKDVKTDWAKAVANITVEHPMKTSVVKCEISLELMSNILHLAVWDRSMDMKTIELRLLNVAKSQHQINTNRYFIDDSVQQNTIKCCLGWILSQMQNKSELDFILAPEGKHITSVMAIGQTRSPSLGLGQLRRTLSLLASLRPNNMYVGLFLRALASIGAAYAYHILTQTTQGPWSKAYLNELRQNLLTLMKYFLKNLASSLMPGSKPI